MKLRALFACLALGASAVAATPAVDSRIAATCALMLGRVPSSGELAALPASNLTVTDLVVNLRHRLAADSTLRRTVATRAWRDAFGTAPTDDQLALDAAALTYSEHVQQHLRWLATHPVDYRSVLDRAYRLVVHRDAFAEEVAYWRQRCPEALPFVLLVGCIDDWARRNQPGLTVTSGVPTVSPNCLHLGVVRLPPADAGELHAAFFPRSNYDALAMATGHNLLAPGAAPLVTSGHSHFVAVGR